MKYKIITLGCKVNEYESEVMSNLLENHGYIKSENPDVCIVNTCTVTNTADSKSRKMIRSLRRKYPKAILIVAGCMIQNKKDKLDVPADIIIGNKYKSDIVSLLEEYKNKPMYLVEDMETADFEDMSLNNFDLTRAYIKIEDGCDNYCSYCIIPYVRGHVRSKKHEKVIEEAKALIKNNHKEIVLTGIHTGHYHDGDYSFADLLKDLVKLDGLKRLRISSIEITEINDDVLDVIQNSDVLVNHMHIPLQSGSDEILKQMNRKYDKKYFINKIKKLKTVKPDMNVTTDIIVGFPGESAEEFEECIETIKKIGFTKIHVFPYSDREGTVASKMANKIPGNIKKERVRKLLELSKSLEIDYMNKHLGSEVTFIPEVYDDGYLIGHTANYLLIKVKGDESLLSEEVIVKISKVDYPYLLGELKVFELSR